jgi:hypothetical protein
MHPSQTQPQTRQTADRAARNPLHETFLPRYICRDLMDIKGNGLQLGLYMALIFGFKPLMDDWIHKDRMDAFKKACRGYGIHVREDIVFHNVRKEQIPDDVKGRQMLTTTSVYGLPLETQTNDEVHVFLSRNKNNLKKAMWYPVIIGNRVIFGPRIDHLKYGRVLGYPDCCINFFRTFNNWIRYSHLYETLRHTDGRPHFVCNPFLKDTVFSYIYHMPCSYRCVKTIRLCTGLRKVLLKNEPAYVERTDRYLKMPFLVFYEKKSYMFEGRLKGTTLKYSHAYFTTHDTRQDTYGPCLKRADRIQLQGRTLVLFRGPRRLTAIHVPKTQFAPENPFLIQCAD